MSATTGRRDRELLTPHAAAIRAVEVRRAGSTPRTSWAIVLVALASGAIALWGFFGATSMAFLGGGWSIGGVLAVVLLPLPLQIGLARLDARRRGPAGAAPIAAAAPLLYLWLVGARSEDPRAAYPFWVLLALQPAVLIVVVLGYVGPYALWVHGW